MEHRPVSTRRRAGSTVAVVATALLLSIALSAAVVPASAAPSEDVTVDQSVDSQTVAAGESVTVTATLSAGDHDAPGLDVELPSGWTIVDQSSDGVYKASTNQWVWLESGEKTVQYTVAVPADADVGARAISARVSATTGDEIVSETTNATLYVGSSPPTPTLTHRPSAPSVGETVTFDASESDDSDGSVVAYEWDLDGDGEFEAVGRNASHSYEGTGTHAVTLRVTDDAGVRNETTETLTVTDSEAGETGGSFPPLPGGSDDSDDADDSDGRTESPPDPQPSSNASDDPDRETSVERDGDSDATDGADPVTNETTDSGGDGMGPSLLPTLLALAAGVLFARRRE